MSAHPQPSKSVPLPMLPQLVPSQVCFRCTVCCRFPEADSYLRPYFTEEEIGRAVSAGVDRSHFPEASGCQVKVVPNSSGEGFFCPAFDPRTAHCTIYAVRPLDCQIYPLALMWNKEHTEIVLGWDTKCPFLGQGAGHEARGEREEGAFSSIPVPLASSPSLKEYAERIAALIEQTQTPESLARHTGLVGPFQEDVVVLRTLPRLTRRFVTTLTPDASALAPLRLEDRPRFDATCATMETVLGAYAFPWHFIWRDLFAYSHVEIVNHLCLFAVYGDGIFMPLPPLCLAPAAGPSPAATANFAEAVAGCFAFMQECNKGSAVSRIENVPEGQKPVLEALGYRARPKDPDYLYRTADLVALAGDRYKSQRAAVNRFRRASNFRVEPYAAGHREACLRLFHEWAEQKHAYGLDGTASQMLRDSESAHRQALTYPQELGMKGTVVWVDEAIRAYTFGYDRSPRVYCVLLEVADRAIHGLAQFLFRETCLEAQHRSIEYINALDDSALPDLAKTKRAYHPVELVTSYVFTAK